MNSNRSRKLRLDALLVERGVVESREKAMPLILAGAVVVEGVVVDKSGTRVPRDAEIMLKERARFVSRGGEKLDHALKTFGVSAEGKRCLDVGASTGGFSDCLLRMGAASVHALDVGYGQLHASLRSDARVTVVERTNVRRVKPEDFADLFDLIAVDVSFISLRLVLPVVKGLLASGGDVIALVKPQFEARREKAVRGVVRDPAARAEVMNGIRAFCSESGFQVVAETASPVRGPKGNVEFFIHLRHWSSP